MRRTKTLTQNLLRPSNQPMIRINIVPPKAIIKTKYGKNKTINITQPKYVTPKELGKGGIHPFMEIKNLETSMWLQKFSDNILNHEKDSNHPLLNPDLDFTRPGISGFRIYVNPECFSHIQVTRVPSEKSLFQLDYYEGVCNADGSEENISKIMMVAVADINEKNFNSINLIYASSELEKIDETFSKFDSDLEYARRASCLFRFIQVYMRIWEYHEKACVCEILPFEVFGKVYYGE